MLLFLVQAVRSGIESNKLTSSIAGEGYFHFRNLNVSSTIAEVVEYLDSQDWSGGISRFKTGGGGISRFARWRGEFLNFL